MENIHAQGPNFFKKGDLSELEDDSASDGSGGDTSLSLRAPLRLTTDEFSCNGAARNASCCVAIAVAVCAQQPSLCGAYTKICVGFNSKAKTACEEAKTSQPQNKTDTGDESSEEM